MKKLLFSFYSLSRFKLFVFFIIFINISISFIVLYYFSFNGNNKNLSDNNLVKNELFYSSYNNKYYNHNDMYFMTDIYPNMIKVIEKISKLHIKQSEDGWLNNTNISIPSFPYNVINTLVSDYKYKENFEDILNNYWNECWNDKDNIDYIYSNNNSYFRLSQDIICNFLWMLKLRQEPIESIDKVLSVITSSNINERVPGDKPTQSGGLRGKLSSGIYGYWKPCTNKTGSGESYMSEIVAYHIDRLLQFNRAPAVVPRFISTNDFNILSTRYHYHDIGKKINSILTYCGQENNTGAEGSIVGWSPFNVYLLSNSERKVFAPNLAKLSVNELFQFKTDKMNITVNSDPNTIHWALETITGHMFSALTDPKVNRGSPMIYIDNDRAQWNDYAHGISNSNPIELFCIFPKTLSERIMMLSKTKITLGDILENISEIYAPIMKEKPLFTKEMSRQLQKNIQYLTNTIENCINLKGEDLVLIPEIYNTTSKTNINIIKDISFDNLLKILL